MRWQVKPQVSPGWEGELRGKQASGAPSHSPVFTPDSGALDPGVGAHRESACQLACPAGPALGLDFLMEILNASKR